jgi:hypothetical protein
MTAREIIRTGLILGGIWIVISGAAGLAPAIAGYLELSIGTDPDVGDLAWTLFLPIGGNLVAFLLLALGPGLYVIEKSSKWAASLTPEAGGEIELGPSMLLAVGLMILGLALIVDGAASLLFAPLSWWTAAQMDYKPQFVGSAVGGAAYSLLRLVAGILIYKWGSRSVLHTA